MLFDWVMLFNRHYSDRKYRSCDVVSCLQAGVRDLSMSLASVFNLIFSSSTFKCPIRQVPPFVAFYFCFYFNKEMDA